MKKTLRSHNNTLRRIRPKTAARNKECGCRCRSLIDEDIAEYGRPVCHWCGEYGVIDIPDDFNAIWCHHTDGDRNNLEFDNLYPCHNRCQTSEIHPNNIDVRVYPNREAWLRQRA